MKKIIIINGPNLNLLGNRENGIYGKNSLDEIKLKVEKKCTELSLNCFFCQSNNEGVLIDFVQSAVNKFDGLIINPAAFTHTSVALLDALRAVDKPKIEIHLSNVYTREDYRKKSITSEGVNGLICGFGTLSYILAVEAINELINNK
jgi:3-dehydroquinate dehydratase-2|tara:strand:- start:35 stop:475 length:441 start_codon:yes stop_codon:yes gene_type:complete